MKKNYKLFLTLVLTICMVVTSTVTVFAGTISLDKTNAYISVGETLTLHLSNTKKNRTVYWKISDSSIATVNSKGVVKGVSEGTTVVTARYRQKSYSCYLTVTQNRNTKELERLINEVISKSDKLGMSKADIIRLIDERIAKIPPTTPSGIAPSQNQNLSVYPSGPFNWRIAIKDGDHGYIGNNTMVNIDGITSSYVKNDFYTVANSSDVQPTFNTYKAFKKYTLFFSATGKIPPSAMNPSYTNKYIEITLSSETSTLYDYIILNGQINSDGTFIATNTSLYNSLGVYYLDGVKIDPTNGGY